MKLFNALAKKTNIFVIFERKSASDRPAEFYSENEYNFNYKFIEKGSIGRENSFSFKPKHLQNIKVQ